jgi:hypothetical protein
VGKEIIFLSEYKQHKQQKKDEQQERDYFKNMQLISDNHLRSINTKEDFQKFNNIWYLDGPLDDDLQLCQDFGQKLDITRQEKLAEKLKPKTIPTIIYLASVRASKN